MYSREFPTGGNFLFFVVCMMSLFRLPRGKLAFAQRSGAMKAPVGLLSDRTVLRSKMEGLTPTTFVNGISGHELELDDTSSSNLGHPTVAVLPALLAIGEETGCSGRLLLEGFLIATEVTCKLGRICAKRLHAKGWHCSSVTAGIGAAAGCAYLLGLSQEQTSHALGIAASMASGLRENFGTQTKSIHIGKCAEDGYRAS